ncbi:amino acid adenylation domain-containing protein [Serratia ureilytica]|nr:amino acid adenylation domain-containing protein [Serratia ureilytica]
MIETQDRPLSAVDILSATERTLLLDTWNRTEAPYPAEQCLHQLFEAQVSLSPSAPAVVYEDDSLSYGELNARANRLAHRLIAEGVKPDGRVGICVERGPAMIVGLLAILKAGGAYVPLDPSYPGDRLRYILQDAGPETVLADTAGRAALGEALSGLRVLDPGAAYAGSEDNPQVQGLTSRHLAYVIYTSGSTGMPKGVMNEHRGVVNRLIWMQQKYSLTLKDAVLQKTPFSFDVSVWEFFWPLMFGVRLVLAHPEGHKDPVYLSQLIDKGCITTLHFVPSMLQSFLAMNKAQVCGGSVARVICSGEALPKNIIRAFYHQWPHAKLHNLYGPTEAAIDVTAWECTNFENITNIPIGRPIANTRLYLLNEQRQPVPLGAPGELYIGGAGVARGYLNRPELTDECFLADPFSDIPGARMYKTGDLARYLPDGNLVFLGRNDHQVKIRGFRIEPGEIEARLAEHPDVREAVVMARDDGHGGLRLVAYVVGDADAGTLRQFLSGRLPEYMVPAAFVPLTSLPLTPNGKLDRRALPAPDGEAFAREAYEAPQGEEEEMLATIWSELLGQAQISRHDSFFALGGHSLLAVQMIDQLRRRGVRLAVQDLFKTPVLSALALRLTPLDESPVPDNLIPKNARCITPEMLPLVSLTQPEIDRVVASVQGGVQNVQDIYGLSPLQDGILFHHLLATQGDPYLLVDQMAFNDRRSLDRYLAALQRVVARHDILRTGFVWQGMTVPVQVVWREAPLAISELTLDPADGPIGRQLAERFNPHHHRIDLSQAPLIRFAIAQDGDGRWLLLELMHHLIGDHSTLEIMHHEVQAFLADSGAELAPPQPFRNLIAQIRQGKSEDEHKQFFGAMLADIEEPTLPFGLSDVYQDGTGISESHRMFTPELNARLRHECRRLGVSLASLCHLAWGMVLSRITGQARVVFGTVLFGRLQGGSGAAQAMGLFINTLPVRIDVDNTAVAVSVRAAHGRLAALLEHEHASLALAQRCSAVPAGTPLFSALLNYRHNASSPAAEVPAGERLSAEERTNYPFALSVEDFGDALGVTAQVQAPAEAARVCGYMQQALESLADALAQAPECEVRELETVPPEERTLLLDTWNRTEAPYPAEQCLHQLFEAQVSLSPSAPAVVYEDDSLSYGELNARANRLAHRLIAEGVKPDGRVGICVERGPAMIVGLLAILKAGGAYVPLDPSYPGDRLRYILQDAGPETVLADTAGRAALGEALSGLRVLDPGAAYAGSEDNPQVQGLTSRHLAYVIYTSGSTGLPKGVMVEHQQIVNSTRARNGVYVAGRTILLPSFSFDASVGIIFHVITSGSPLVLLMSDDNLEISMLSRRIRECQIEVWLSSPSLYQTLLNYNHESLTSLRYVILGGEAPPKTLQQDHFSIKEIEASLYLEYGPTETTVWSTVREIPSVESLNIIGRPIANTRLYLLNEQRQPVPLGAPGELYIGGAGVTRGYLNRPELTDERFLADPFSDIPGARMYKTGDLARYLPDGNLVFLGRNDHQVKIRGFRIEPGEIEARLAEHPDVREAVVMARDDGHGGLRLVAYVVGDADAGTLRQFLSGRLPEYMVPAAFVPLTSLPLTPNGKLDRRALPAPDGEAFAREAYEAPQGDEEEMLATIWSELLGQAQISRHDSFFALGGHSLLAMRLVNMLAARGISASLSLIFANPVLQNFAACLIRQQDQDRQILPPIKRSDREEYLPLSFAQQRLWFLAQMDGQGEVYHIPMALHLKGALDVDALQYALNSVFSRHEAWRSTFVTHDGKPQVKLLAAEHGLPLQYHDLRGQSDVAIATFCADEAHTAFDLVQGPLVRARLLALAHDEHVFLLTQHHIVSDGWSFSVLVTELSTLYQAALAGEASPLAPLAIQYPDYAAWQRQYLSGELLQSQADYWRETLADAPVLLDLPTDRPRPDKQSLAGAFVPVCIDAATTEKLKALSQKHGVTLFMVLIAAWGEVLSRLSGQSDLVIGTPSANRGRHETEALIGFFVNTLAIRIDLSEELNTAALLKQVRDRVLAAQEHQDLPFEQIVEMVNPPRSLAHSPLFQVMLAWQNMDKGEWQLPGLTVQPFELEYDVAKFDLELHLGESNGEITGALGYSTALFDQETIQRHVGYLEAVLQAMIETQDRPLSAVDILSATERTLLLDTWNRTEAPYPAEQCLHQLFEAQVSLSPSAPAVVYEDDSLSYGELNARANRLAHRLIAEGVKPDGRVGICVERGPAMIVGLLAILKAGGAYVPLDPSYPGDRLRYILQDAGPETVLADTAGRAALGEALSGLRVLDPGAAYTGSEDNPQVQGLTSRHLAYVIYTSGSTGLPKGVMVEHQQIVNSTRARNGVYVAGRTILLPSFSFDASVGIIFHVITSGSPLVLLMSDDNLEISMLSRRIRECQIEVWLSSPSLYQTLLNYNHESLTSLRYVILGGEAPPKTLQQDHFSTKEIEASLYLEYGPTETTVWSTVREIPSVESLNIIGRPIANTRLYLLNEQRQPVPLGAPGELYIGGAGVARGYLNRPELTDECFLADPFSDIPGARMYKTGDLARYLPDGNLVFLGRNDHQVKIRGFRIEPGEIEARLAEHPDVREAVVMARDDGHGGLRLVAYVVGDADAGTLRQFLSGRLPEYMVPAAFVPLTSLPLTPNGKLDRRALPAPDGEAFAREAYEAPQGEEEEMLATIWSELLGQAQISRHDSFFALGGHSLLAVQMIDQLRRRGVRLAVQDLFKTPVLSALALRLTPLDESPVPDNLIPKNARCITPEMLPLVSLTQPEIDRVVASVQGGVQNVQDIYGLSPLQDGILFHHLLATQGDPYLLVGQMAFNDRRSLDRYLAALQRVVARHDILRTGFVWQGMTVPVQVVWREAPLAISELTLDPADGPIGRQLAERFNPRHHRIDLSQAPLIRFAIAQDGDGRWLLLELMHHLIGDHSTLEIMHHEVQAFLADSGAELAPPQPFRNLIAQIRQGKSEDEHKQFFGAMLADIEEPTLPFGLSDVYQDGTGISESHRMFTPELNARLRHECRRLGVSLASLCHLAWGMVLSRITGQARVVFGTVLFGRLQGGSGAAQAMGLFINTLPVRIDVDNTAVAVSVRAAHGRLAALLEHEHASLALAQRCSAVPAGTPLFSALLNYRHNASSPAAEVPAGERLSAEERTNYPFTLSVEDFGDALGVTAQVQAPAEAARVCGYMQQALESLADALAQAPECEVRELETVPPEERTLLLDTWNRTEAPYPAEQCLHQLFEAQVSLSPSAPAVVYEDDSLSYGELNARANRLAHRLIAEGVKPDGRVGICVERGPAMIVGLLAILKAGGAYVPLDPSYPGDRLRYILQDAGPETVLADTAGRAALGEALSGLRVLDPGAAYAGSEDNPQVQGLTSRHLAYVIYTSGSTGLPKGVMQEHSSLTNLIRWQLSTSKLERNEFLINRTLQFAVLSFDVSFQEIFSSLCSGAILELIDNDYRTDFLRLFDRLAASRVERVFLPYMALLHFSENLISHGYDFKKLSIKEVITSGEQLIMTPAIIEFVKNLKFRLLNNQYGPTETHVVTQFRYKLLAEELNSIVPIGRPIANTRLYLLNEQRQPVPLGAPGELYIGGAGVARGYLNRPELTDECFLADPFSDIPGARMYKTGDLARYLPDGNLVFLGRNDHQVKIRGFRIEPGEIEARLAEHPDVREAVVMARDDGHGGLRLVAYVVGDADAGTLRQFLSGRLPEYMVPAAFVPLTSLPLTPNGKLDRRALPAPDGEAFAREAYEAPQGDEEEMLATIWSELLGQAQISRHDSFFALGGHSLLAMRLVNMLAARGISASLSLIFANPVLQNFAACLIRQQDQDRQILPPIKRSDREEYLPLSFAQQRLWFLAQMDGQGEVYHIPMALHLKGALDVDALQYALNSVFSRHEAWRSTFVTHDGKPQVKLLAAEHGLPLQYHDLRGQSDVAIATFCADEAHTAFDLVQGPLVRARLLALAHDEHVFLLTQHHIVSDGWSFSVLVTELSTLYQAALAGEASPLAPLAIQYPDYAAWQRQYLSGELLQSQADYWRETLADAPVLLDLPTDRPRPDKQSLAGAFVPVCIDAATTEKLKALSQKHGVTLFMVLIAAWGEVLSRLSGQSDLVIGTPSANRGRHETEALIGFFVNTLAIRIDLSEELNTAALLKQVRDRVLAAQEHQDLPFEQIVEMVNPPRSLAHSPLFQVMLAWQNMDKGEWQLPGLTVQPFELEYDVAKFDLELHLGESNGEITGALGYSTALFDQETIQRHVGYLEAVLQAMIETQDRPLSAVDILSATERTLLLDTWNRTEAPYPAEQCLHQLFEAQVSLSPSAPAVVYEDDSLSYGELNARANRLAHRLIAEGVKPDGRVGICVERGPAMIVGLLAILKAGGAYVPLDPSYPGDRLRYILQDAGPETVLADTAGRAALGEALSGLRVLDPGAAYAGSEDNPQVQGLTSRHLAYVIYTSGSTGLPKGVMVEHKGVLNYLYFANKKYGSNRCINSVLSSSIAFDATVTSLYTPWLSGGLVDIIKDGEELNVLPSTIMEVKNKTIVKVTPSLLSVMGKVFEIDKKMNIEVSFIVGGEQLPSSVLSVIKDIYDGFKIFNEYGPTEAVVGCCIFDTRSFEIEFDSVPVGKAIANTRLYLLNEQRQPVPLGAPGELYIGGAGVARGYLNRPELTDECFLADPFSDIPGARMYKTGDLARYLPDGNLVFLGRNDHQVKIRGFRIEPGEIEARLAEHPDVREAVVMARDDGHGGLRLVAYVVGDADAGTLRQFLSGRLPDYMVPAAFVPLTSLPLTPNGKLDRRALPAPDGEAFAREAYEAPQGEEEEMLATIWSELLGQAQISRHDSFFALGGHSLLAIKMIESVRRQGYSMKLNDVFEYPALAKLSNKIIEVRTDYHGGAIPVRSYGRGMPLFFVPTTSGDYSYSYSLAENIDIDRPVYVLPWPSIHTFDEQKIGGVVNDMINALKVIQPGGEYSIIGYSSSGVIAYAIAEELIRRGESIAHVVLIDTYYPRYLNSLITNVETLFVNDVIDKNSDDLEFIDELLRLKEKYKLREIISLIREKYGEIKNMSVDVEARQWELRHHMEVEIALYTPSSISVPVYLYYATEDYTPLSIEARYVEYLKNIPTDLGWKAIVPSWCFNAIPVSGNHISLIANKSNRKQLASKLSSIL